MLPIARCIWVPTLPITRCHRVACCLSQAVLLRKIIMSRCHCVATFPIAWCHRRLSFGFSVWQVSHLMEPSFSYVPNVKVSSCAYVPHVKVPSCAFVSHRVCSYYAQSCSSHRVPPVCQARLSHDTRVCKVAHLTVPSCAKFALVKVPACANVSHVKVPSRAKVFQVNVQSCPYVAHHMVRLCPSCPYQSSPSHGVLPMCQERLSHDTRMCKVTHIMMALCAKVAHVKVPTCNNVSHVKVPS